jgi:hypothetical protein
MNMSFNIPDSVRRVTPPKTTAPTTIKLHPPNQIPILRSTCLVITGDDSTICDRFNNDVEKFLILTDLIDEFSALTEL